MEGAEKVCATAGYTAAAVFQHETTGSKISLLPVARDAFF
jgi:hypothetical protein